MYRAIVALVFMFVGQLAAAGMPDVSFPSIDGGQIHMSDWDGQPVLVVNTASQCAFTGQYAELQALYDAYRADGLIVLAVPSDDFRQELDSAEEVKEFCEMNFGLDMPMTDIMQVKGADAHPLYQTVKDITGFVPKWNFSKILFAPDGEVIATWGSRTPPMSAPIRRAVTDALTRQ
ncbi:glutathione peroxidase [Tateyamaria armeniaca]|uniref:Glutathione peroxidase n=1 Tax=Tateyamaria armeniaca TaxID=2518930 RepID=A0ABW8UPW6_9RHOB